MGHNAFDPEIEELLLAPIAKEMAGKPLDESLTEDSPSTRPSAKR